MDLKLVKLKKKMKNPSYSYKLLQQKATKQDKIEDMKWS